MKTIEVKAAQSVTKVYVGQSLDALSELIPVSRTVIITDRTVYPMLKDRLPDVPVYQVYPGDYSKSLRVATTIYRWLQELSADRNAFILGVGGGVPCDLAGFVAATYLRGVRLGFVPTTLLAQVDASIGGKNALNLYGFKNIVGTFYQPEFILCDHTLLKTLPEVEIHGGIAEMIKHSIITSEEKFDFIRDNSSQIASLQENVILPLIDWSIGVKKHFIELDEHDNDIRRVLNLGHTWGHAVEGITGIHHGQAVAIGMVFAVRFANHLGLCDHSIVEKIENILTTYGLPTRTDVLPWVIFEAMLRDKKRDADAINFVFPTRIGHCEIHKITIADLKRYIQTL